jgi:hypothetical protein
VWAAYTDILAGCKGSFDVYRRENIQSAFMKLHHKVLFFNIELIYKV